MKKILVLLAGVSIMSACTYNAKDEAIAKQEALKQVKDSLRLDSFQRAEAKRQEEQVKQKAELARLEEEKRVLLLSERNEAAAAPVVRNEEAPAPQKKGWSSAAKGAAIGAGAGALGGVLIDKKDGRGAIIGGVVGAGTGYLIGRDKDRKSGRVKPKN